MVQFDLRFYVVALLFVIFDVELAFFFPWAVVFGSATRAGRRNRNRRKCVSRRRRTFNRRTQRTSDYAAAAAAANASFAWVAFADILVFFRRAVGRLRLLVAAGRFRMGEEFGAAVREV